MSFRHSFGTGALPTVLTYGTDVPVGTTLTIPAGSQLKFANPYWASMSVEGSLIANGDAATMVCTSRLDDGGDHRFRVRHQRVGLPPGRRPCLRGGTETEATRGKHDHEGRVGFHGDFLGRGGPRHSDHSTAPAAGQSGGRRSALCDPLPPAVERSEEREPPGPETACRS